MIKLVEPTLLLDKRQCLSNLATMAEKARRSKVEFRPHFKTHQSHEVGRWFRDYGVTKITVSSLKMAVYFAADGWDDITVAFPVNIHEINRIHELAQKIKLNLLVVDPDTIDQLAAQVTEPVNFFIEVDTGFHRSGVAQDDYETVHQILKKIKKYNHFQPAGFLTHAGHTYRSEGNTNKILSIHSNALQAMTALKNEFIREYPDLIVSVGDTPSCSIADSFEGADEIRPGNFIFYDMAQQSIGSCSLYQIAVVMACPVVAKYRERNTVVVHGGSVHFSKDAGLLPGNIPYYGKVVWLRDNGWSSEETRMYVKSFSQEHGVIHAPDDQLMKINVGDFLGVLPIHSCLTADAMKKYLTLDGDIITMMM